ncbi:Hypothetical predicted protein [Podarcis lilfordi]|uniref:Uncharacterized protein n=1 Tax=Podarcis lilfordi TaxID=74358 RepID=A0AA35PGF6_9SAUR|nr:Hypothetical predicted protein [Podarcis lilfordi]
MSRIPAGDFHSNAAALRVPTSRESGAEGFKLLFLSSVGRKTQLLSFCQRKPEKRNRGRDFRLLFPGAASAAPRNAEETGCGQSLPGQRPARHLEETGKDRNANGQDPDGGEKSRLEKQLL